MMRLQRLIERLIAPLNWVGEVAVALMCLHIVVDIAANILGNPLEGTEDLVAKWYMIAVVFLPMAYLQHHRQHIKAEILVERLSPGARAFLVAVGHVLMIVLCALLGHYTFLDAIDATARGERLELVDGAIPLWPARWLVPLGFVTMGLVALLQVLLSVADLGRPSGSARSARPSKGGEPE